MDPKHRRVQYDGNGHYIEDLGSVSGTKVNGKGVDRGPLPAGATIKLGNTEIGFNNAPMVAPAAVDGGVTKVIKSAPSLAWLAVSDGPSRGQTFSLNAGDSTIGRDPGNQITIDDAYLSRRHAKLRVEGGKVCLFDLGSSGGTRVNGQPVGGRGVEPDSVIRVGETEIVLMEIYDPRQFAAAVSNGMTMVERRGNQVGVLVVKSGLDAGKSFILSDGDNLIGRDSGCSIRLNEESVSREHALLRCQDGKITLFDVGSRSGTTINGQTIGGLSLADGDVISMGRTEFTMMAPVK